MGTSTLCLVFFKGQFLVCVCHVVDGADRVIEAWMMLQVAMDYHQPWPYEFEEQMGKER